MHIFCYVQKRETSGKHCGEVVKIIIGRPRSETGHIVENCGEAVRMFGRPRSETGHIVENCGEAVRICGRPRSETGHIVENTVVKQ